MKCLIIIPAHNEEVNILFTLNSLKQQTYQAYKCIVVNDGSTDKTEELVREFISKSDGSKFELISTGKEGHIPGAKVVRTFEAGLKTADLDAYSIICKFDADIVFPREYLQKIAAVYLSNPKVGMVSGIVKIKKAVFEVSRVYDFKDDKKHWKFEDISSKDHVRGPIKSYRKECLAQMNGLRPVLGWDNIDVMLATKNGWETVTLRNLWVKHLRPTAEIYKDQKARKLGEYFYNIGLSWPLMVVSALKAAYKSNSFRQFFITAQAFLAQNHDRHLSSDEIQYVRKLRWKQLFRSRK